MTQISLSRVEVAFGAHVVLRDVTWTVASGERWGVVGRNGSGKTTVLHLLSGEQEPAAGAVARQPGLRFASLEQFRDFGDAETVWDAAAGPFDHLRALERALGEQAARLGVLGDDATHHDMNRYAHDLERFEREGGYTYAARVDAVLHGLGFDPEASRRRALSALSGGERGRVALARQLVAPADVMLLDEPTNHLDLDTTAWLEGFLRDCRETIIVVSHDRALLDGIVDHVLHLEGETTTTYTGGYTSFVRQRAERRLAQQRAYEQQRRTIAREEEYIRRNIAGVNSRQAKGRRTRLERLPRLSAPAPDDSEAMSLRLEASERGGNQVVVAEHVRLSRNDRLLIDDFTATVERGDIVGVIGANGSGKSTLLEALLGSVALADGVIRLGGSIRVGYYDQELQQIPLDRSLYDIIADLRPAWGRGAILSHLARFGFSGDAVQRLASTLSGGERARIALSRLMLARANLLVLDEPTNHLDVETIELLEDAIAEYDGTVILVSHDRELLRALTTRIWSLVDGRITDFPGGFAEYEAARAERARAAAADAARAADQRRDRTRRRTVRVKDDERVAAAERRAAREALAATEADVLRLDERVRVLTAQLEDPALYGDSDGVQRAMSLNQELESTRRALEEAMERWARAADA